MTAETKSKTRTARNIAGGLAALLFLASGFVFIATRTRATSGADEQAKARAGFTVDGVLEADEVDVSSKLPGRIKEMFVDEGDFVTQGQVLAVLEAEEIDAKFDQAQAGVKASQAQLAQGRIAVDLEQSKAQAQVQQAAAGVSAAQSALAMARSKLTALENGARPQERVMADQALNAARAQFDTAQKSWNRVKSLADEGVVPQQRADEVEMAYLSAKAQYEGARAKVDMVYEGARPEEVQAARDQVRQAQAGVEAAAQTLNMARAALLMVDIRGKDVEAAEQKVAASQGQLHEVQAYQRQTEIKAPIAGRVSQRMVRAGEIVAPGYAIMSVTRTDAFWVSVFVDETAFAGRGAGQAVTVDVPATGKSYQGVVSQALPAASFATKRATNENGSYDVRSVQVRVTLKGNPKGLVSGLTARVLFPGVKKGG